MTVYLQRFVFDPQRYVAPHRTVVGDDTLETLFLRNDPKALCLTIDWPWNVSALRALDANESVWTWLQAVTTPALLGLSIDAPLAQCIEQLPEEILVARYLYDHRYSHFHPQVQDPEHLSLVHGTIAAKLYDDGVCILDHDGVRASMHWRSVRAKGTTLSNKGHRDRG